MSAGGLIGKSKSQNLRDPRVWMGSGANRSAREKRAGESWNGSRLKRRVTNSCVMPDNHG